jgi:hypothetical protein
LPDGDAETTSPRRGPRPFLAGHRSTDSTLTYIHLSGRDLAEKLNRGMEQIHGWRVRTLARLGEQAAAGTP